MFITPEHWLEIIDREYLRDFISHGGSSVKFIIPINGIRNNLQMLLQEASNAAHFQFGFVNAKETPIHLMDRLFFSIAQQIDWGTLANAYFTEILKDIYILPQDPTQINLRELARLNNKDPKQLRPEVNNHLRDTLFRDYHMCQDFRIAMFRLCQAQLGPEGGSPVESIIIEQWLCGELRRISEIKPAQIFQKITRHNARHMLTSLAYWLHLAGRNGLILMLDIAHYLRQKPRSMDITELTKYYGLAATLDAYEVLREFIDSTDTMEYCLIVVTAPSTFLQPYENRGIERYDALKMRLINEVKDRKRANPFSTLVRLAPCDFEEQSDSEDLIW